MLSALSLSAIGVVMLVLFGVFYFLGIFTTIRALLAFAGVCVLGLGAGWFGHTLSTVVTWATTLGGTVTGTVFGISVTSAVFIIAAVVFVHDLLPKHGASKRTGWIGILVAAMLVAGVSGFAQLNSIPSTVRGVVSNARTIGG